MTDQATSRNLEARMPALIETVDGIEIRATAACPLKQAARTYNYAMSGNWEQADVEAEHGQQDSGYPKAFAAARKTIADRDLLGLATAINRLTEAARRYYVVAK